MGKRWWLKKKKELGLIPDDGAGKPSIFDGLGLYALFPWLKRPKKEGTGEYGPSRLWFVLLSVYRCVVHAPNKEDSGECATCAVEISVDDGSV